MGYYYFLVIIEIFDCMSLKVLYKNSIFSLYVFLYISYRIICECIIHEIYKSYIFFHYYFKIHTHTQTHTNTNKRDEGRCG